MMAPETTICHTLMLPYQATVTIEWQRRGPWDKHWGVYMNSPSLRHRVAQRCTYTEARKFVESVMARPDMKKIITEAERAS
jgi:hypothetical protein